jgi:hypothetical protein
MLLSARLTIRAASANDSSLGGHRGGERDVDSQDVD